MRGLLSGLLAALVASQTLAPPAGAAASSGPLYVCRGDEPPWTLELDDAGGTLTRPSAAGADGQALVGRLRRFEQLDPPWVLWRGHTRAGAYTMVATLRAESCRSALPDAAEMPYRALVSFPDGSVASGCCQLEQRPEVLAPPTAATGAVVPTP